jgi:hypothetical protein
VGDLLTLFSEAKSGGWLPIVVAFVALPALYFLLAVDVHKDYAELAKFDAEARTRKLTGDGLLIKIDRTLYLFELDWYVVAATAVLLVLIACLPQLLELSPEMSRSCGHQGMWPDCDMGKSVLRLYCIMVGLVISFRIGWGRLAAARELRYLYADLPQGSGEEAMPPSGYSPAQGVLLTRFLKSCAEDLEKEANDKGEKISEAVERELRDITRHLQEDENSAMQKAILGATLAFYERLGTHVSVDAEDYQHSVQSALDEVLSEIATIKI